MKSLGSNQILSIVKQDEILSTLFYEESAKQGLSWSAQINGGCKIKNKKVGVQKFHNAQLAIARFVYNNNTTKA